MEMPPLNGLVLAGGKSTRMGSDKGLLDYNGRPQREYLYQLLQPLCNDVFISCNEAQGANIALPAIVDAFPDSGPMGALLSALKAAPGKAWLVVACDMPFLTRTTFDYLAVHRTPAKAASVFINPEDDLPEPLIAIWEPAAAAALYPAFDRKAFSLRRVLAALDVAFLSPPAAHELQNVNDPVIFTEAMAQLGRLSKSSTIRP